MLETYVNHSLKTRRFVVFLVTLFGAAGTLLSAIGLYGLLSYSIAVRRRELGIRMAIGATGRAIAALICFGGIRLVIAGAGARMRGRFCRAPLYREPALRCGFRRSDRVAGGRARHRTGGHACLRSACVASGADESRRIAALTRLTNKPAGSASWSSPDTRRTLRRIYRAGAHPAPGCWRRQSPRAAAPESPACRASR